MTSTTAACSPSGTRILGLLETNPQRRRRIVDENRAARVGTGYRLARPDDVRASNAEMFRTYVGEPVHGFKARNARRSEVGDWRARLARAEESAERGQR